VFFLSVGDGTGCSECERVDARGETSPKVIGFLDDVDEDACSAWGGASLAERRRAGLEGLKDGADVLGECSIREGDASGIAFDAKASATYVGDRRLEEERPKLELCGERGDSWRGLP
jgi:hypothetical protein